MLDEWISSPGTSTIVIGGGLTGLAAAAYLARAGRRVAVLEKGPTLGGRAVTDVRGGYAVNRGNHALYTGGAASEVLHEPGVSYTSGIPSNLSALDRRGLHRLPAGPEDPGASTLLTAPEKRELLRILSVVDRMRPSSVAYQSVAEWISTATRSSRLSKVLTSLAHVYLYSDALDVASSDAFLGRLQQTLRYPIHYIDGGWQTLVDRLGRAARQAGVRVMTSAGVAGVHVRDEHAYSVRLSDGSELPTTDVVLAVTPREALKLVRHLPHCEHLGDIVHELLPAEVACLDLALARLPAPEHPIVFHLEQPLFAAAQSQFARLAPDDGCVLHLVKHLDPRRDSNPREDRAQLEQFVDQIQPGWRDVVVEQRFLPRMLVTGALPLARQGGLAGRPSPRSNIASNLYFAGDWIGPRGWLVDASLDSAREVARLILNPEVLPASDGRRGLRRSVRAA
jgi:phytoene dehydrogenase-like protein